MLSGATLRARNEHRATFQMNLIIASGDGKMESSLLISALYILILLFTIGLPLILVALELRSPVWDPDREPGEGGDGYDGGDGGGE